MLIFENYSLRHLFTHSSHHQAWKKYEKTRHFHTRCGKAGNAKNLEWNKMYGGVSGGDGGNSGGITNDKLQ